MGFRLAPSFEREAVLPNGSVAPGSIVRSWRRIPGAGVEDFWVAEGFRTRPYIFLIIKWLLLLPPHRRGVFAKKPL